MAGHLIADILKTVEHRTYPLPRGPWVMRQTWRDLLFAHWPFPPHALQALLPAALELDTYGGQAWLGVVPFAMRDVHPRGLWSVGGLSHFLELNVRTYVRAEEHGIVKPGVYFFSLDAANPIAVALARKFFRLPYFTAQMAQWETRAGWIEYRSRRTHARAAPAGFSAAYRPTGRVYLSTPGTLDHWLTERYALYTVDPKGRPYIGEIHHVPWPLQPAAAELAAGDLVGASAALRLPDLPPLLHFARRIDMAAWPLRRLRP
jgi:uncharacterized protein YqjF (DUF2071 family)